MRKHIFNAGPCKLPDSTLENVSKAVLEFGNTGQSIMEAVSYTHLKASWVGKACR